jgi:hypothetical protein
MPLITRLRLPPPQLIGVGLAEFQAPLANSFVGHPDPAGDEQLLYQMLMARLYNVGNLTTEVLPCPVVGLW